jgi:hypothetical protein
VSTFSDPRIIEELRKNFVVGVGNTHELQNQKMPAGKWFMEVARRINPRVNNGITAQGFYVVAADGTAYGFNNNRSPDRVLSFLEKGREQFAQSPPKPVEIPAELINARFTNAPDPSIATLRVFSRIRPLPAGCDVSNANVARDHLWVYPEEVDAILAGGEFPKTLAYRMARYHLVDNIRGEPNMWSLKEVKTATFKATAKKGTGAVRTFALQGDYDMATSDAARGLKGTMEGEIVIDPATKKVVRFRAYGEAEAWGRGEYTPNPPPGRFKMVFAIVDVADEIARTTPPQAAAYWDGDYRRAAPKG